MDKKTLEIIAQVGLTTLSTIGLILVARKNRWGTVFCLAAQPFWLLTFLLNGQWGSYAVSVIYTATWAYAVYGWFFKGKGKTPTIDKTVKALRVYGGVACRYLYLPVVPYFFREVLPSVFKLKREG